MLDVGLATAETEVTVGAEAAEAKAKAPKFLRATEKAISKALASSQLWAPGAAENTKSTLAQDVATAVGETLKPVFQSFTDSANCIVNPPMPKVRAQIRWLQQ